MFSGDRDLRSILRSRPFFPSLHSSLPLLGFWVLVSVIWFDDRRCSWFMVYAVKASFPPFVLNEAVSALDPLHLPCRRLPNKVLGTLLSFLFGGGRSSFHLVFFLCIFFDGFLVRLFPWWNCTFGFKDLIPLPSPFPNTGRGDWS